MRRRFRKWRPAALQFLTAGALLVLSCGCLRAQGVEPPHRLPDVGFAIHTVTPTKSVDFTNFAVHLATAVKAKFFARVPKLSALMGDKVVVRITIQKDGTLASQPPSVEESSGKKGLDSAAVEVVRSAAPFDHLPDAFDGPSVELLLAFALKPHQ